MEIFKLKTHVGKDGILKLELPIGQADVDCEVSVTVQPSLSREEWISFHRKDGWKSVR